MNVWWAKTRAGRSWHVLRDDRESTRCGHPAKVSTIVDARPQGKTCETCLRIVAPK